MWNSFRRALANLDLEERILNGAIVASLVFLFFPWLSGQFLGGDPVSYSGVQFYVSYIGVAILALQAFVLLMTFLPILGGPQLVKRPLRSAVRLWACAQVAVLTIASLSVLTRVTYEFRGLGLRYGVYFSLVCSLIATLYAFLQWQEERRAEVQDLFHHPEDQTHPVPAAAPDVRPQSVPPPPPPPPPLPPEEHNLRLRP
jgi:hypothetical protein